MDLVIDSNVLFAALLKDSGTSDILFTHKLYAPEFIFEEFRKYKEYLKGKTKRNEENFTNFLIYLSGMLYSFQKKKLSFSTKKLKRFLQMQKMFHIWLLP